MNQFLLIYLLACTVHITVRAEKRAVAGNITKLLLMPLLLLYYLSLHGETGFPSLLVILALSFGFVGDAFLLDTRKDSPWFLVGMASFLLGHLCYIAYMAMHRVSFVFPIIAVVLVIAPLRYALKQVADSPYRIPMNIYGSALGILIISCASTGSIPAIVGAICFSLSDYFIAMEVVGRKTFRCASVMSTYMLAQLLLVVGILSMQGVLLS